MASSMMTGTGNLIKYFNNATYSDVTIRLSDREMKAHRIILAHGSEYFRAAFDGDFKEAFAATIELKEDDPFAVCALLAFLYGEFRSDVGRDRSNDKDANDTQERDVRYMLYQVDVYVVASKYLVPTLCTQVMSGFDLMLDGVPKNKGYPAYIKYVAKRIYLKHADAAEEMRRPLVTFLGKHLGEWAGSEEFGQLLRDVPQMGIELIRSAVESAATIDVAEVQDTPSGNRRAPKRKR